jgi:quercetin dioxygenase-like cupin family protein
MNTATAYKVLAPGEGLRLQSGPGRDLIFKVTGEDTCGAFDFFIVEVAPGGGPPLHVHNEQEETIHVLKGRFKVRIGDEVFHLEEGGFAYLPSKVPHAFLNLTGDLAEVIIVYTQVADTSFIRSWDPFREVIRETQRPSRHSLRNTT